MSGDSALLPGAAQRARACEPLVLGPALAMDSNPGTCRDENGR